MLLSQNKYAIKSKQICYVKTNMLLVKTNMLLSQNKYAIKSKQICY